MKTSLLNLRAKIRGFTLIEMLVVIAIITLLTGIIMTSLTGSKSKARDAKRISDIGNIQLALELFFDRCKQYPSTISGTLTSIVNGCPTGISLGSFISVIPTQPNSTSASYDYRILTTNSVVTDYVLHVGLESYNAVVKDALASLPNGTGWTNVSGSSTFTCSNNSTDYCIGPK